MTSRRALLLALVLLAAAPPAWTAQEDVQSAALIGLARVSRDAGDPAGAARYFQAARARRALTVDELTEYFWVLRAVDQGAALAVAGEILRTRPMHDAVRDGAIGAAIERGDETTVASLAEEGRLMHPGASRWLRRLGESALRRGRASDAADQFRAAAGSRDGQPEDWLACAVSLTAAGRHVEALTVWNRVPPSLIGERVDLSRLRLQSMAQGAGADVAAAELEAWLALHPYDRLVRSWLVDLWERAANPARAFAAAKPMTDDGDVEWLRRSGQLARAAGLHAEALSSLAALLATSEATRTDRLAYVDVALQLADYPKAAAAIDRLLSPLRACDQDVLAQADRLPGAAGTDRLFAAIRRLACADSTWGTRTVARLVAEQRHVDALSAIGLMRTPPPALVRQRGLLLQWTGASAEALQTLEPFLAGHPDDVEVRLAVVDAHRARGQAYAAFAAAEPILESPGLPVERRVEFARLALEADAPARALVLADAMAGAAGANDVADVRGRALLTLGRPGDAVVALESIASAQLSAQAATALLDALAASRGAADARRRADALAADGVRWPEVAARRLMLAQMLGDTDAAATLRAEFCRVAPTECAIADVQAQLALEQPLSALRRLEALSDPPAAVQALVDDLRALALEGVGEYAQALRIVGSLRTAAPSRVSLLVRERTLRWRIARDSANLAAVVELAPRAQGDWSVTLAIARTLNDAAHHADTVRLLAGPSAGALPLEGRVMLAEALRATGDTQGALAALGDAALPTVRGAILKAELQAAVLGPAAAIATLREWAARADAPESLFVTWSALEQPGDTRLAMLSEATSRQPRSGRLAAMLAVEHWRAGHADAARREADRALALDPTSESAWFVAVDATADAGSEVDFQKLLLRLRAEVLSSPGLVIAVSDHVAGLVHDPESRPARGLLSLLGSLTDRQLPPVDRHLTEARLAAAIQDWPTALTAIDKARRKDARSLKVMRLRADVLGWAGRHADSVEAYTEYLQRAPDDLDARRQQARVAGWGGRFTEARRLYETLRLAHAGERAVVAEAAAKVAFYDGRWREAVRAYRTWIELEPDNTEARFEQAEALRASGQPAAAEKLLGELAVRADHRLAAAALSRSRDGRRPVVSYVDERRSAAGFEGARLLELRRQGGRVSWTHGDVGQLTLFASASQLYAGSSGRLVPGAQGSVGGSVVFSPSLALQGYAGAWAFGSRRTADARLMATWKVTDRFAVSAGAGIEPVVENMATLDASLTARGPFGSLRWAPPAGVVDAGASRQYLSDGNARTRVNLSASRIVSERARGLRFVVWAEASRYAVAMPAYFSPSLFIRADAGVEYTHLLLRPRYAGDRQRSLRVAFLEGTDNHGVRYHHPSLGASLPFGRWFTMNATADWIRSAAYDESSFTVDIRVNGLAAPR